MSGISGMVNLDGRAVDRALLQSMTDSLAFRGPDQQHTWVDGYVGFGHAMLRTTFEAERESQPLSLDGRVWIVADARIDARAGLLSKLGLPTHGEFPPEPELILRAYARWGTRCVEHLLGDFAFAVWDSREQRLFCARDQFGIKPLFYAHGNAQFVFGNTLQMLLLHPSITRELDDAFIVDFLAVGYCTDPAASVYRDVRRLPPAHTLTCENGKVIVRRYWELPTQTAKVKYANDADLVAHFGDTLRLAVEDRLRTGRVAVYMSGGMDSSSVAALARKSLTAPAELRAYTVVYDHLIPDEERQYARLVADHLGIPIEFLVADDYRLFETEDRPTTRPPEPVADPLPAIGQNLVGLAARAQRVVLDGNGGDPVLYGTSVIDLTARFGPFRMLWLLRYLARRPRDRPEVGIRRWWRRRSRPTVPGWLNPELARKTNLAARVESAFAPLRSTHPTHPEAHRLLTDPLWAGLAEVSDPGWTRHTIESRFPFLDRRVIDMVLGIPPWPWCANKQVLRESMLDYLPRSIVRRPKVPLMGDPVSLLVPQIQSQMTKEDWNLQEVGDYVDVGRVRTSLQSAACSESILRLLCLWHWLRPTN